MRTTKQATMVRRGIVGAGLVLVVAVCARPTLIQGGVTPMTWPTCHPEQVEVMVLGTFHFAQQDEIEILSTSVQGEISALVTRLEGFGPDRVAVEAPLIENDELNRLYTRYLERRDETLGSANEIYQLGFRLARRLGHGEVYGVDVPMNLWHDSITVFDERYPGARDRLRARWDVRHSSTTAVDGERPLAEILAAGNEAEPPPNSEMYARFLPLVEGDVYAGALKLRPWYDRNLRIVQNLFRILEPDHRRALLVIGWGHVRTLKHILDLTPQLCAVDPSPVISSGGGPGDPSSDRRTEARHVR